MVLRTSRALNIPFKPWRSLQRRGLHSTRVKREPNSPQQTANVTKETPLPVMSNPQTRIHRVNARLPRFLQTYTTPLLHAPASHMTSFLILHEITAVVPLFGFAGLFYYSGWSPSWLSEWKGVDEGVARFTKWFKKKGWIKDEEQEGGGKEGARLVLAFATSYALTKAFLPARLIFSVWATPWFARICITPMVNLSRRILGLKQPSPASVGKISATTGTSANTGSTGSVLDTKTKM